MKVSDIIRIGDKIDIRVLQEVEQAEKTDVTVKTYKSKVLDFCSNGNMEIAMPMEAGKLVLLQLGVRYELVFFSRESLYRTVGQVKERYKKDNIYMLEMELKSQPEKFQRREYFRYPCLLDFKYYELTAEHANATNLFLLRTGSVFLRKTTFSGVSADLLPKAIFCVFKTAFSTPRSLPLNASPFASITFVGFGTKSTAPRSMASMVTSASFVVVVLTIMTVARILSF